MSIFSRVASFFANLFSKKQTEVPPVNTVGLVTPVPQYFPPAVPSTPPAPIQFGTVSVGPSASITYATPASDPVAKEWSRRRLKYGDDLWAVQAGENISLTLADMAPAKAAGFTKTEDFAVKWAGGRPVEAASDFDPNQAEVSSATDCGKNFHFGPGAFTRTLDIPEGYTGGVRCSVEKINDHVDDAITIYVDGLQVTKAGNFPAGPFAVVRGAGRHTITGTASNNTFVWQLQLVP
jgi:hypothetical protein